MAYGLQDGGFVLKRLVDIRSDLKQRLETHLGGPIDDSGNSVLGMLTGITSQGLAVLWSELSKVSDNMNPDTSSGENLYDWGLRRGIQPKPAQSYATNSVQLKVDSGSETIVAGTVIEIDGLDFELYDDVTVTSTSFQPIGVWTATVVGAHTLNGDSGTVGAVDWQFSGGTGGRNAESEDEFRIRVSERTSDTGCATDIAMTQRLAQLPYLIDAQVVSNRTMNTVNGMLPKSYEAIIAPVGALTPPQETDVLDLLLEIQPAGIRSNQFTAGTFITHTYNDINDSIKTEVNATIATEVVVDVDVTVIGDFNTQSIQDGITAAFGVNRIGENVLAGSLYCGVTGIATVSNIEVNGSSIQTIGMRERAILGTVTVST